jgi:subtilisin family serine protease
MKKSSAFYLAAFLILCPTFVLAQNSKKKVASAADLPRFSYEVPEKLTDLLMNDESYKLFAARVRTDLEGVLRDYEIEDKTTLKRIQTTLAELDFQENRLDSALKRFRQIVELEEKPELKYLPDFFDTQIFARAQKQSGAVSGEKFLQSLRLILAETLNALPDSIFASVKEFRYGYDFTNEKFAMGIIEGQLAPIAKKNGKKLFDKEAYQVISLRIIHRSVVPVVGEFAKGFDAYIAARKTTPKINVWTNRAVSLTGKEKLSPVVVAVWDTGVDPTVFPSQMFVNRREKTDGKDNDRNNFADDIHGIGFDVNGKYTTEPLFFVKDKDAKKYAQWIKERRVVVKLQDTVDDDETRALKKKFQAQSPTDIAEELRLYNIFSTYTHGTEVAAIVIEGNPAARILNARSTWRDQSGQDDSIINNEDWARVFAANIRAFVDYFKKQNTRVVNMSWSMSRNGIEENLEKNAPTMTAEERKIAAQKSFTIIKNALVEAFRSAPKILFVCSAGNTNSDAGFNERVPSSLELPNLITVGAVDESGAAANFTNFGKNVLFYAQGKNVPALIPGGEKFIFGGTSAATPAVANLAAKLFALNPNLTVAEVVKLIQNGADTSETDNRLKLINPKRSAELLVLPKK